MILNIIIGLILIPLIFGMVGFFIENYQNSKYYNQYPEKGELFTIGNIEEFWKTFYILILAKNENNEILTEKEEKYKRFYENYFSKTYEEKSKYWGYNK